MNGNIYARICNVTRNIGRILMVAMVTITIEVECKNIKIN